MKTKDKRSIKRTLGRVLTVVVTVLLLITLTLSGVILILVKGPSPTARRLFVLSVKETSAGGFLADLFLTDEEVAQILGSDAGSQTDEKTDTSLIIIPDKNDTSNDSQGTTSQGGGITVPDNDDTDTSAPSDSTENDGIEVIDITGSTYNGKLMIVDDPSRVFVGVPGEYGEGQSGLTVAAMIDKYGAVAGTNAGGFYDPNGQGTGGIPDGIVIYEGELKWGNLGTTYNLAGFDQNGILHVGNMTAAHALDIGIRYAASYGPALVINGKPSGAYLGGGLNPRTAIGQRADGAVLLLVVNGRSVESLGATLDDLTEIMMSYGAVNASNLDGGSSSIMIMNGERLTSSAYIFGERVVATAIIVK